MFSDPLRCLTLMLRACRSNFSFKCHRRDQTPSAKDQSLVYAVNDITFHPVHGTFSTCGMYMSFEVLRTGFSCVSQDRTELSTTGTKMHARVSRVSHVSASPRLLSTYDPHTPAFDPAPGPVSATCFNRTGSIFAYAISYDWSKGHSGMTPGHPNKLMLHACKDDEVKKKPPKR